ncbi:MAG: hypothetical protein WC048_10905 [Rhizobium sp.]
MQDEQAINAGFTQAMILTFSQCKGTSAVPAHSHRRKHSLLPERMTTMPDKVTLINWVWMATMSTMLATSVAFYMNETSAAKFYGPPITAVYHTFGH